MRYPWHLNTRPARIGIPVRLFERVRGRERERKRGASQGHVAYWMVGPRLRVLLCRHPLAAPPLRLPQAATATTRTHTQTHTLTHLHRHCHACTRLLARRAGPPGLSYAVASGEGGQERQTAGKGKQRFPISTAEQRIVDAFNKL